MIRPDAVVRPFNTLPFTMHSFILQSDLLKHKMKRNEKKTKTQQPFEAISSDIHSVIQCIKVTLKRETCLLRSSGPLATFVIQNQLWPQAPQTNNKTIKSSD